MNRRVRKAFYYEREKEKSWSFKRVENKEINLKLCLWDLRRRRREEKKKYAT